MRQVKKDLSLPKRDARTALWAFGTGKLPKPFYELKWGVEDAVKDQVRVILDLSIGTNWTIDY